ncbi:hypothetical protein DFJ74DRAFT_680865 [Hyaloraphidium curvatum]|nr:hypothetical protein DFJ74DRAFT_680865 [Hyaloraphidium curvatum]
MSEPVSPPPLSALGRHPLLFAPARLPAARIAGLLRFPGLPDDADTWLLAPGMHPVRRAEVMGIVVGIEHTRAATMHILDDGTGVVRVVELIPKDRQNSMDSPRTFEIGTLLRASGIVTQWGEQMRLTLNDARVEEPAAEPAWWLGCVELERDVYSKPWDVVAGLRDEKKEQPRT